MLWFVVIGIAIVAIIVTIVLLTRKKKSSGCTPNCSQCGLSDGCGGECPCPTGFQCQNGACINPNCTPDCTGKVCGDDGCGGSCGGCPTNYTCKSGQCIAPNCTPNCTGKKCGDDGCGGSCGTCATGSACQNGLCITCNPDCTGKKCGDDGCGGSCGTCPTGQKCSNGVCASTCIPNCKGMTCGDDGCGGSCGTCSSTQKCVNNNCVGYYFIYGYSQPNYGGVEMFLGYVGGNKFKFTTDKNNASIFYYNGNLGLVTAMGATPANDGWLTPLNFTGDCSKLNEIVLSTVETPYNISSSGDLSLNGVNGIIQSIGSSGGGMTLGVRCPGYVCKNPFGVTCLNVKMVPIQT